MSPPLPDSIGPMRAVHTILSLCLTTLPSLPAQPPADSWQSVADILKAKGKLQADGTFRIDVPRKHPELRNELGFVVPPSTVLTYAAFAGTPSDATVFGDTCMLPEEVN